MKSTKLKVFALAISLLAFSATFAQDDTTSKPQPDTTMPKKDTTSMITPGINKPDSDALVIKSFIAKNDNFVAAKIEAIDNSSKQFIAKIS